MRPPAFQDAFHERNILVTDHRWPVLRGRVKVITCTPGDRLESIAAVMVSKHVRHLPVVTNNKLIGIVSIRDLLRLHLKAVQSDADGMRRYIQEH